MIRIRSLFKAVQQSPGLTSGKESFAYLDQFGALRTTVRPPLWPGTGRYKMSGNTAIYTALAAASELFHFRWTDTQFTALIWQVSVNVAMTTAASANGTIDRQLVIARNWTTDGSGGTTVTLGGNAFKTKTIGMPPSRVGTIRFSSGTALGTGTKTNDAQGVGVSVGSVSSTFGQVIPKSDLYNAIAGPAGAPIQLMANEGLVVLMPTAMPSSVALITYVEVDWSEIPNNQYP